MAPSAQLCCCRHGKKKPLTEGIRRSTEVGTMVLNVSGKYDPQLITANPVPGPLNGAVAHKSNGASRRLSQQPADPIESTSAFIQCDDYVRRLQERPIETKPTLALDRPIAELAYDESGRWETARTSRGEAVKDHLSMKELMRQVRIEEGLQVTPRPSISETVVMSRRATLQPGGTVNMHETYTIYEQNETMASASVTEIDHQLGYVNGFLTLVPPKRAVFNENGDISARPAEVALDMEALDARYVYGGKIPTVSESIDRREFSPLTYPRPETGQTALIKAVTAIPQTLETAATVIYTYCVTMLAYLMSFVWK